MLNDVRMAIRSLGRRPGFTTVAVLTLALGSGANAAVFSLLDAVYFRPLPLRDTKRLVRITSAFPKTVYGMLSYSDLTELARVAPALEQVVAAGDRGVTLHHDGETRVLKISYVSPNYFEAFGIPLAQGRGLAPADAQAGAPVVVVNHALWRERLGARPDLVGNAIQLNDARFTVVGVTAPGFLGLDRVARTDVWVLAEHARFAHAALAQEVAGRTSRWFEGYGRLASGASLTQARAQLDAAARRWAAEDPRHYSAGGLAANAFDDAQREGAREGGVFLALVGLALLIACANVANLVLARSEGRRRELAVRAALGASRVRLLRHLLAESFVLCLSGVAVGLVLAVWLMRLFPALVPPAAVTYVLDVRFDGRLLGFSVILLVTATALIAAVPAWRHGRADVVGDLRAVPGGEPSGRRWSARDAIAVGETALAVVVLVAAGLLVRSLQHATRIRPGFATDRPVASFFLVPALRGYDAPATQRFFEEARHRAAALPGVRRTSYAIRLPAQANESGWAADVAVPGKEPPPGQDSFRIRYTMVGPGYFEVLGTRILRGRGLEDTDVATATPVAVVSQTMAERLWPGEDPIGKRIVMGRSSPVERAVIGVAEDTRVASLYEARDMYFYVPFAQDPQGFGILLVETEGRPESIFGPVKAALAEMDRGLPVLDVGSLRLFMATVLFDERRDAWVGAGVGLLALMLGAVGVYGTIAVATARRTREIGIRMALGARRADVLRLVTGRGARLALTGCALGCLGGALAARGLSSRLHGVAPDDPSSYAAAVVTLMVAAALASFLPAWRAARTNPALTVREE